MIERTFCDRRHTTDILTQRQGSALMDTMESTLTTPKAGTIVTRVSDKAMNHEVIEDQAIVLADGEFVITSLLGYRTIGRFTGRTRQFWNMHMLTVERYNIETIARDGAIWGVKGALIPGMFAIRPDYKRAVAS